MNAKKTSSPAAADVMQNRLASRPAQKRRPKARDGRARIPHDASYKRHISDPDMVASLLRDYVARDMAGEFDFSTLQRVSGNYVSDSLKIRSSDLVWQINWKNRPFYVLLLLEAQSQPDSWMALRMLCYSSLLWHDMVKTRKLKKGAKLPRLFPVVIYNGKNPWLESMNVASLLEDGPDSTLPLQALQEYRLLDVGRVEKKQISGRPGLVSQLVRLEQAKTHDDACSAVHDLRVQLRDPRHLELRRSFTAWLDRVLLRSKGIDSKKLAREVNDLEDIEAMLRENAANWKQNYVEGNAADWKRNYVEGNAADWKQEYQANLEAQTRAEGRAEGETDKARALLGDMVQDRFGVVPDEVARLIASDCGAETYSRLIRSVYKVKDLQELLEIVMATPTSKRR